MLRENQTYREDERSADVLVVDRDASVGQDLVAYLSDRNYSVEWVDGGEKAYNCLDTRFFDVLVTELNLRRVDGMRLMGVARDRIPEICVIMTTEQADVERATEAMRLGAYDYQTKPLNMGKLEAVIQRGISFQQLVYEQHHLKRRLDEHYGLASLMGESRAMTRVYNTVRQSASVLTPVVITGEAGTGRDLVAQAIHHTSLHRDGVFVKLDCRAGTAESIETELFGAAGSGAGRAELADEGTLYIEHIEALSDRVLEALCALAAGERLIRPVDQKALTTSPHLIVSWNPAKERSKALERFLVALGESSEAISIELPPLRQRKEDIPVLVDYFLAATGTQRDTPGLRVSRNVLELFQRYEWPGNVGELRRCLDGMAMGARPGESLTLNDVPQSIRDDAPHVEGDIRIPGGATMRDIERIAITETMRACDGKKEECARRLGIGLRTLYRKLKEYDESGLG